MVVVFLWFSFFVWGSFVSHFVVFLGFFDFFLICPDHTRTQDEDVYVFSKSGTCRSLCCAAAAIYTGFLRRYFSKRPRGARNRKMKFKALFPACQEDWDR